MIVLFDVAKELLLRWAKLRTVVLISFGRLLVRLLRGTEARDEFDAFVKRTKRELGIQ
jgi:hypothetical protein